MVVCVLLFVFQPFGLYNASPFSSKMLVIAGYGLITAAVVLVNGILLPILLPQFFDRDRWTLGKDILLGGLPNFIFVGFVNAGYSIWAFNFPATARTFLFFQAATMSVGFLPYLLVILYRHNQLLRRYALEAAAINSDIPGRKGLIAAKEDEVTLHSESKYEQLTLKVSDFLFACSADNYVRIYHMAQGDMKESLLRTTLKNLEQAFEGHVQIIRCHRGYLVNANQVQSAEGNAQGLKLKLEGCEESVPVARGKVAEVRALVSGT